MKLYLVWLPGRENPVEIPADAVSWKDDKTVRFNQYLRDDEGNCRKDKDGELMYRTVAVYWTSNICGFSWAEQTAQY
jgi:hypothetical protein